MKGQLSTFWLIAAACIPLLLVTGVMSAKIAEDPLWSWATTLLTYFAFLFVIAIVMYLLRPRVPPG